MVSEIVGRRVKKGKVEYRVSWKGFPPEEDTWELGTSLRETCKVLIREFNSQVRHKRGRSQQSVTMTAYGSHSLSPHSSPPLKKTTLSECSSDQLSVMSATNCSPRSVSPALTASITPPITTPVKCSEMPHSSSSHSRASASKGTKRSPAKSPSSGSPSPGGSRKKVMVVFNSADADSPPPSSPADSKVVERKRDYNTPDTAAKATPKALTQRTPSMPQNRQLFPASSKQKEAGGSASSVAKDKRVNAQAASCVEQFHAASQSIKGSDKKSTLVPTKDSVPVSKNTAASQSIKGSDKKSVLVPTKDSVSVSKNTATSQSIKGSDKKSVLVPTKDSAPVSKNAATSQSADTGKEKSTVRRKYVRKKPLKSEKEKKAKGKSGKVGQKAGGARAKVKREKAEKGASAKHAMKSGKKTKEYIKLKAKKLNKPEKRRRPISPMSPRSFKTYEPPMHQLQIQAANTQDARSVAVLVVYALDRIKKMKRKGDADNIYDLVSRMDTGLSNKKPVIERAMEMMEANGQLLRWEGTNNDSFRVSRRAIEELGIDNSDGYLSVAPDRRQVSLAQANLMKGLKRESKVGRPKKNEALAKKRKLTDKMKSGVDPVLPLPLTKRRKMLEEASEVSGSSGSLLPTDAPISKEGKSGKDSTHSSAGSTSSGTSQSLVNKACNLLENIQNKTKTNAHVYMVGKHVLLVPPTSGGSAPDMSKQMSSLPHKRFAPGSREGGNGVPSATSATAAPVVQPPTGGTTSYPIERRISVRQTESAFKFKEITVRKHDAFVEIAIQSNSGHLKNVFTLTTLNELQQALQSATHDCDSRLLLLTGSDRAFSHGADLHHVAHCRSSEATARYTESLRSFLVSLANFPKPVVAAVNGPAIGLGAALLPLCDIVYASDKAHLQLPYCHLGQTPEGGSSFTLPHLIGSAVASDMFMSGRKLTASEACDRGLVSEVFWPSVLMQQVIPRCRRIAQCPPLSLESTKCIIRSQMREQLIYAIESECSMLTECWENNECKRKIQEYLNSKADSIL